MSSLCFIAFSLAATVGDTRSFLILGGMTHAAIVLYRIHGRRQEFLQKGAKYSLVHSPGEGKVPLLPMPAGAHDRILYSPAVTRSWADAEKPRDAFIIYKRSACPVLTLNDFECYDFINYETKNVGMISDVRPVISDLYVDITRRVRGTIVCVCLSVEYVANNSRTQKPIVTIFGRKVQVSRSKVKR